MLLLKYTRRVWSSVVTSGKVSWVILSIAFQVQYRIHTTPPPAMTMYSALLTILLAGAGPVSAQLDSLAKGAGLLYFGTAVDNPSLSNSAYTAIAFNSSEFGQITPANGQKWDSIEPSQNTFSYAKGDAVTTKAQAAGQIIRCHNLVWYNQLPSWGKSRLDSSTRFL